ncbi:hypothetical protein LCL87_24995 [Rhodococcus hoagii]|nr:hypothetical protein [Prescottella equi]
MSTAEQIIADVLGEHGTKAYVAAHVAAALTNAGKTIVEQENVEWAIVGVDGQDEWIDTGEHEGHLSSQEKAQQRVDDYYRGDETAIVVRRFVTEWQPVAAARVAEGGERGE